MNTRLFSAIAAVPILLVLVVTQSLASSIDLKVADRQVALSKAIAVDVPDTWSKPALKSPITKGRQRRECRILRTKC